MLRPLYNGNGDFMKTIHVVAAIIQHKNEIMIAQRLKGEFAGQWEFPGGKVELNETPQEALKRELMEEMELPIEVHDFLMTAEYDYSTFHLSMNCYMCSADNKPIHLHDHTAVKWIPITTSHTDIDWVPADVQVFKAAQKRIQGY